MFNTHLLLYLWIFHSLISWADAAAPLEGVICCSLTAALVTAPVRNDLLDAAGSLLVVVLLLQQPILSANLFC